MRRIFAAAEIEPSYATRRRKARRISAASVPATGSSALLSSSFLRRAANDEPQIHGARQTHRNPMLSHDTALNGRVESIETGSSPDQPRAPNIPIRCARPDESPYGPHGGLPRETTTRPHFAPRHRRSANFFTPSVFESYRIHADSPPSSSLIPQSCMQRKVSPEAIAIRPGSYPEIKTAPVSWGTHRGRDDVRDASEKSRRGGYRWRV